MPQTLGSSLNPHEEVQSYTQACLSASHQDTVYWLKLENW